MGRHILFALFLSLSSQLAWADIVELTTGQRVQGTLKEVGPAAVTVEVDGQAITLDREKVRAIYFGPAPTTSLQPSPRDQALTALQAFQAATQVEVTYQDYTARLADTKIVVNRYLRDAAPGPLREALGAALRYYLLARDAWGESASGTPDLERLARDPDVQACAPLQEAVRRMYPYVEQSFQRQYGKNLPLTPEMIKGWIIAQGSSRLLWACASEKLTEAERLLK